MRFLVPFFLIITGIALMFGVPSPALATDYFVTTDGDDTDDGTNWAMAFLTISNAVAQTEDGDTITVSNGTYGIDAQIYITNSITVQSVNGVTNTTIKRNASGSDAPQHRIFYLNHASAVVDGFTITNGYIPASNGGGGVYLKGGTIKNCVIMKCYAYYGGGAYIYQSGTIKDSTITGNQADLVASVGAGGGVYLYQGGLVRNCLISGNTHRNYGGVCLNAGGTVENCTISRNSGSGANGVYANSSAGTIKNTIIYFNSGGNRAGGTYSYTCTTPDVSGTSNTTDNPLFVNYTNNNYRLRPGSPCIDTGTNEAWMTNAVDLDGNDRIINDTVDMGAYELKEGDLLCALVADSLEGFDPYSVVLTGYVSATNTAGLGFQWDVDDNGSIDFQGPIASYPGPTAPFSVVTNVYTSGLFTVVLTVTNSVGETNAHTRINYIRVGPATNYVDAASASPAFPYATWATAAANIGDSVDAGVDGTLVLVTDGTYEISSQITISRGITLQSVNGREVTTIKATAGNYSVQPSHADAVVDGFTITKKSSETYGGGVYMSGGTVRNCVIKDTRINSSYSCGVKISGGTVSNCTISGNRGKYAGGVWMSGASTIVSDCVITGNWNFTDTSYSAGGVVMQSGTLRNCLITDNESVGSGAGGVHIYTGGTVESCTISGNSSTKNAVTAVGGLRIDTGTLRNSIIYFSTNTATGSTTNWYRYGGVITYSCTTPDASAYGTGNITSDPRFVNAGAENYCLHPGSPCVNVGTNQAWMTGAVDLRGKDRIDNGTVDMGAYESFMEGTIFSAY